MAPETKFKQTEIGLIPEGRIMNSKPWPIVEVQEVCDLIVDCVNKTAPTVDHITPYKMIRTTNIRSGKVDLTTCRHVEADTYEKWTRRAKVKAGDILLTREAPLGEVGYISLDDTVFLGQRIMQYRANPKVLDSRYLHYAFLSPALRYQFGMHEGSGSVVSHIRVGDCYKFKITLPPLNEQRAISHILGTLDDKIELNNQINQKLEAMAQAIFKSWFVDFDPVKAKIAAIEAGEDAEGATRAAMSAISGKTDEELDRLRAEQPECYIQLKTTAELFPSTMQDSELGEVPEGWIGSNFGEVSACFDKNRIPLSKRQRDQKKGSIPYYGATSVMDHVDKHIFDGIYLLLGEDGSVLKNDGSPFIQYIWGKSWVNNHAHVLQGANGVSTEHLMLFMQSQNITAYVTGAVQLKLNQKNMNSIPFINAGKSINDAFYASIAPLYACKRNAEEEIKSLSNTRDTLLPKLLSGELSVDAAKFAEE